MAGHLCWRCQIYGYVVMKELQQKGGGGGGRKYEKNSNEKIDKMQ